jgi:hypothetical protein
MKPLKSIGISEEKRHYYMEVGDSNSKDAEP